MNVNFDMNYYGIELHVEVSGCVNDWDIVSVENHGKEIEDWESAFGYFNFIDMMLPLANEQAMEGE